MALTTTPGMRVLIEGWEGCVLHAYPDPATGGDPWTIGYGHTGPDVHQGQTVTQAQADGLLVNDLHKFETAVEGMVGTAPTSQQQFDALVSFAFNLGAGRLKTRTLLKLHIARDYPGAAAEFPKWDHPTNLPGILKRRRAEAAIYLNGDYGQPVA